MHVLYYTGGIMAVTIFNLNLFISVFTSTGEIYTLPIVSMKDKALLSSLTLLPLSIGYW